MAKNIVICSDGTGNSAIKGRGTNVFKMFESIDLNRHRFEPQLKPQVAIYDDGVGTESFKLAKILGGAAGYGLSRNVKQLYKELCRVYDPGDQLFLFGFSRGAFTIRTLAGFICTCGILKVKDTGTSDALERKVEAAYKEYRRGYRTDLMKVFLGAPSREKTVRFRSEHSHGDETIAFIGVWDTVDAVGLPLHIADVVNKTIYQFKFPNLVLSHSVLKACHALAIDDERQSFHPLLWDESRKSEEQVIEQVWFAGAHSNVGGGYPKQGMSLVALDWMMEKAASAGLRFVADDRRFYHEHASVDDKLYNPRSGTGTFYRWLPRNIDAICRNSNLAPVLHLSVLERIAHGTEDYGPGNLPPASAVAYTPTKDPVRDRAAQDRAEAARQVLAGGHADGRSLLDSVSGAVRIGRWSYRAFLIAVLALLLAAATPEGSTMIFGWASWRALPETLWSLLSSPIDASLGLGKRLLAEPKVLIAPVIALLAAFASMRYSDRRIARVYSHHWFARQQDLRDALKRVRVAATARTSEAA